MVLTPGVVQPPLPAGTHLIGSFKLINEERPIFDRLLSALPDPGKFAQALVPGLRRLLDVPQMKGIFDSLVIEAVTEYVRTHEFSDRPSRLECLFGCMTQQAAEAFAQKYRPKTPHVVYEVESVAKTWFADLGGIGAGLDYFTMPLPASLERQLGRARQYLELMTVDPKQTAAMSDLELLAPGGATIVRSVSVVT